MYHEARNDAKLRTLDDSQHRVWFNLMCMASENEQERGSVPYEPPELLAIEVANGNDELLKQTIDKLSRLKITIVDNNKITFINFLKRNNRKPSDEPEELRQRKQKERLAKKENNPVTRCHAMSRDVTHIEKIREDKDVDKNLLIMPTSFDHFWIAYPKKLAKAQAEKAWTKLNPDPSLYDLIMQKLAIAKQSAKWKEKNGEFIPYPATWLNGRRWEDELPNCQSDAIPDLSEMLRRERAEMNGG